MSRTKSRACLSARSAIRVPAAAGIDAGVVVRDLRLIHVAVDLEPAGILHQADGQHMGLGQRRKAQAQRRVEFADARRHHMHRGAMLGQPFHGAGDLDLFHAIGAADGDLLALQQFGVGRRIEEEMVKLAVQFAIGGSSSSVEIDGTGDGVMKACARSSAALGADADRAACSSESSGVCWFERRISGIDKSRETVCPALIAGRATHNETRLQSSAVDGACHGRA